MDVKIFRILSFLLLLFGEFFCFSFILKPMVKKNRGHFSEIFFQILFLFTGGRSVVLEDFFL